MDKFLEIIHLKTKQVDELQEVIDKNNNSIEEINSNQETIKNRISDLEVEYNKNEELVWKINNFSFAKKRVKVCSILVFIIKILVYTVPIAAVSLFSNTPTLILFALLLDIMGGIESYKEYKRMKTDAINEIKNYTIVDLEKRNEEIEHEKTRLKTKKIDNEASILNLKKKIEKCKCQMVALQEDIKFIKSVRREIVDELCTEILDKQFEIEQSNPSFQKVLKQDNK